MSQQHRKLNRWRLHAVAKQVVAVGRIQNLPCHRCGKAIDYLLPGTVPMGPTADHIVPVVTLLATGGDPYDFYGMAPSHRVCNQKAGAALSNDGEPRRTSREW